MKSLGLLIVFALGVAAAPESQKAGQVENQLEGEILLVREIFPLSLTLRERGRERSIGLDPSTKVLIDSKEVLPGRLAPGQRVRIHVATTAGRQVVERVEILPHGAKAIMQPEPKRSRRPTENTPAAADADRATSSLPSDGGTRPDGLRKPSAEGRTEPMLVMPELELSPEQIEVGPTEYLGQSEYDELQKIPPIEHLIAERNSSESDPAP